MYETKLSDLNDMDYYFTNEDHNTFYKDNIYKTTSDIGSRRKVVQQKLLELNKHLLPLIENRGYRLYNHYNPKNITSLHYCTPYGNNNCVDWLGLRYGQHPDIVKEIDKDNIFESTNNPDYGFLSYQCFQIMIADKGLEIGIYHSIPRNSFDRGYVHDKLDSEDPDFKVKLNEAIGRLNGYGIQWNANGVIFDFDNRNLSEFVDYYRYNDQFYTYSKCTVIIPKRSRLLLANNIVQTCIDYIDIMYPLFEAIRWHIKEDKYQ